MHELKIPKPLQCSLCHDKKIAVITAIESVGNVQIARMQNRYKTMLILLRRFIFTKTLVTR